MDYPPEVEQAAREIKSLQESRSPKWMKQTRIGGWLEKARPHLDDATFTQWVEQDLDMPQALAWAYMKFTRQLMPDSMRKPDDNLW